MNLTTVQYSIVFGETTRADEIQPQRITTALNVLVQQCFIPKLALIDCVFTLALFVNFYYAVLRIFTI
jgi:hypothetical protein